MAKPPLHPFARAALEGLARVGGRALGAAVDSILEDIDEAAEEVSTRAKTARTRVNTRRKKKDADG
ncbi:MAG: hypothetical protein KGK07_15960 [Chloroflexota bacterium]|nr:hypothetical protein [Chloroflexota bacterium]